MKNFGELILSVKNECRIKASDNLDTWIKDIINQELRTLCANSEYPELFVPFATLQIDNDAQSVYPLPVGARILTLVEFAHDTDQPIWHPLTLRNPYVPTLTYGYPNWYFRAGGGIHIFPTSDLTTLNGLRVSYYKTVAALLVDADLPEVPDLDEPLLKRVISRVLRYHKDRGDADATAAEAVGAEARVVQ